jgi:hypothetical protein
LRPPQFFQGIDKRHAQREERHGQSEIQKVVHIHPLQMNPIAQAMLKPLGDCDIRKAKRTRQLAQLQLNYTQRPVKKP